MSKEHLVVDGSNIATEGRTAPSLAQLNEAVTEFVKAHAYDNVVVIVDATFPNRIDESERAEYEEALLAGELLTPPAGAVGRGDAFVLQIADRTGATILSNDSFQEFHATYEWLFSDGRALLRSSRLNNAFRRDDGTWRITRTRTENVLVAPLPTNFASDFPSTSVLTRP